MYSNATEMNLSNNPAYATKTTHERDLAYAVTSISTDEPEKSQAAMNQLEPTYEIVQPSSAQTKNRPGSETSEDANQLEPTYEIVQLPSARIIKRPGSQTGE